MKQYVVLACLGITLGAGTALATGEKANPVALKSRLKVPDTLSQKSKEALSRTMLDHANNMRELWWAVVLLDHKSTERIANKVAKAKKSDADLTLLPDRFYSLNDKLREDFAKLAAAAKAGDPLKVSRKFAALTHTCVRCHAMNLAEPWERKGAKR